MCSFNDSEAFDKSYFDYDDFDDIDSTYEDYDLLESDLLTDRTDEDWREFLNWARDNPEESNYPLRSDYVTERAYQNAVQEWLENAIRVFLYSN